MFMIGKKYFYNEDIRYYNYGNHYYHEQEDRFHDHHRNHFYHDYTSYSNVNFYDYDF